MNNSKPINRREFTLKSAMVILGGATIAVSGCDSDSPTSPTPTNDVTGVVGTNHGHTATIARAELTAANMISLDIQGDSSHPHTVELRAGEVGQIGNGTRVAKDSSTDASHSHTVTFN